ncbi:flagellar biosynthetic protein FliR [Roseiconus lacunae]|uniref:Flagellar biosynthetic protein FliR n=1 Tax=Roseiconus lacunae TaxID=2605694 RepID=A0ABT7PIQ7_9BACT|nr:flagellar biosynthetic protein FliR [Roseiconus lacunae]MDM4016377.1 flagellar biosynthetic protein FliR [Roseiconus lacunae]
MFEHWFPQIPTGLFVADVLPTFAVVVAMVAFRLGGLVFAMPGFSLGVPIRFRVALVILMTVVLAPSVMRSIKPDEWPVLQTASQRELIDQAAVLIVAGSREFILGVVIGSIAQLLISGVQLAGELASSSTGMQLAAVADPATGTSVPQFAKMIGFMTTCVFLGFGGHRLLINALLESFQQVPPMSMSDSEGMLQVIVDQLTIGFRSGVRVAAPLLACVLLSNVLVALISRAVPGLNVMAVGINLNILAAMIVMGLTIGSAGLIFEAELTNSIHQLKVSIRP